MSLRLRILLFLFLFGLLPLMLAVIINLPLVLERVELFYRHAFLQNLRADFSDLDQHLASRDASVRLLAKLPEPGALVGDDNELDKKEIDVARARYTDWINRILAEERDITEILFLDEQGVERFWLERDSKGSWSPTTRRLRGVSPEHAALLLSGRLNNVVLSPLRIDVDANDPARVFTLQLISPIAAGVPGEKPIGLVAITLDIAGLVRRDNKTLWVHDDGRFLHLPGLPTREGNAFEDYPGLKDMFTSNRIVLWEQDNNRVIWIPMFRTVDGDKLWVGRPVDDAPLQSFRSEIVFRVLLIVFGLVFMLFIAARWITRRAERIGRDLTEGVRKTLESDQPVMFEWSGSPELRQLAGDLTRLSQTHASQTRNLRAHARELEATNRYKSEFLANVSHELRTPLNSILLLSKLLANKRDELKGESQEQADVIHKAANDLKALIDNILDLSRIEAGRLETHTESVAVDELLEDLRLLLEPQFAAKSLALDVQIEAGAPGCIETDVDKVRQILKNFLANAVKFTDRGSVILKAAAASPPYAIELSVVDSGIGIEPGKQEAIFEAFQQADGSTSRRYGGTGLGLTISRQLAELLGGEIRLHSTPGSGSTFSLMLPAECGHAAALPARVVDTRPVESHPEGEAAPQPSELRGLHVLLMVPDVRLQLQLSSVLRDWQMVLHLADDFDEAMETLEELEVVDFLMIDVRPPNENACATIKAVRDRLGDSTAIIGLVSGDGESAVHSCPTDIVNDVLAVPCDARALSDVMHRQSAK